MRSLKIAHVLGSLEVGGAEVVVRHLGACQVRDGHDVTVYTIFGGGELEARYRAAGIKVVIGTQKTALRRLVDLFNSFRTAKPDVVHCHNIAATLTAAVAARLASSARVVTTWHSGRVWDSRQGMKYAIACWFCDSVVTVSDAARRVLLSLRLMPHGRISMVHNGVDPIAVPPGAAGATADKTLRIIQVGRLAPPKDPITLLRAFAIVLRSLPESRLCLLGDGPLRAQCEDAARQLGIDSSVEFAGEQRDVAPYLRKSNLFVLSSQSEGLPIAILEALSAGLPCVTTNVGGLAEVVTPTVGLMVPPGEADQMAQAILMIATDTQCLQNAGESIAAIFGSNWSADAMARKYGRLYSGSPAA